MRCVSLIWHEKATTVMIAVNSLLARMAANCFFNMDDVYAAECK